MDKNSQKSDTSMASNSQNAFEILQDVQYPNEIEVNVEDVVESAREIISEKFRKKE